MDSTTLFLFEPVMSRLSQPPTTATVAQPRNADSTTDQQAPKPKSSAYTSCKFWDEGWGYTFEVGNIKARLMAVGDP